MDGPRVGSHPRAVSSLIYCSGSFRFPRGHSRLVLVGNSNTGPEIDRPYVLKILIRSGSVRGSFRVRSGSVRGPFGVRSGSVRNPFGVCRGPFGVRSGSIRGPFGVRSVRSGSVRGRKILKVKGQFPKGRYLNSRLFDLIGSIFILIRSILGPSGT